MDTESTGFTNVQKLDPDIIVDLRYATTNNFTGEVVYDFSTAIARTGTAKKLAVASSIVKEQGYRLKIWDAFRPTKAQKRLFEVYPNPEFVAPPDENYSHQKGVTFDLTMTFANGEECPMPTGFDDFTAMARRSSKWPAEAAKYHKILDDAMKQAGFVGYESEWWDFRDSQMDEYGPLQADPNDYK
ncbi:D-alanyl-D-alanine dipeptidase [Ligilactobacillus pobuzihii]|uniref:M15 family metallopeptidase n=1 Tax=Ligilactobacillus pobuzihii TaxID=449659 RepID=UPI0019D074EF|nr:M15 family metallopeptidase [Ligilactobacillus pobuzihii]MBN7274834.1 D-alanyl-D-alanine dipeptidase [Ligilactobacillus pobuzihii]